MAAIDIGVDCEAGAITAVRIRARTPNPAPMLVGLAPTAVSGVLGRLYAICGAAQRACAELALSAATGYPLAPGRNARLATSVAAEAAQEHLWRLWLDWPKALGLPPRDAAFTRWYGAIRAEARDWPALLGAAVNDDWLGMPTDRLAAFAGLDAFDRWLEADPAPAARLFHALRAEPAAAARVAPVPAGTLDSPLGATSAHQWIAALEDAGRSLEALLAARVVALATLLGALATDPPSLVDLAATCPGRGRGLGSVSTARGWLEHDVTITAGVVSDYAIRTPTERHFAAGGPLETQLLGRPAADRGAAVRAAGLWALAFDPCVSYAVGGAGHA
jgi:hypothetical protein